MFFSDPHVTYLHTYFQGLAGMNADIQALLLDAGLLLLVGMAVVFLFLSLLIGVVNLISRLCSRFAEPQPAVVTPKRTQVPASVSAAEVAAISAAIHQYRNPS